MNISDIIELFINDSIDELKFIDLLLENVDELNKINKEFWRLKRNEYQNVFMSWCVEIKSNINRIQILKHHYFGCERNAPVTLKHIVGMCYDPEKERIKEEINNIITNIIPMAKKTNKFAPLDKLLSDFHIICEINENYLMMKKIEFSDLLLNLKNFIIANNKWPMTGVNRFTKTMRQLIDEHFSEIYQNIFSPRINIIIGKTMNLGSIVKNSDFIVVPQENFFVRSYDLNSLLKLLKNMEIVTTYCVEPLKKMLNSKLVFKFVFPIYCKLLHKLPQDLVRLVLEYTTEFPFFQTQKIIDDGDEFDEKDNKKKHIKDIIKMMLKEC